MVAVERQVLIIWSKCLTIEIWSKTACRFALQRSERNKIPSALFGLWNSNSNFFSYRRPI